VKPTTHTELTLAREASPGLTFDDVEFTAFLKARPGHKPAHAGELLLVHRCLLGDEAALALFEVDSFEPLAAIIANIDRRPGFVDDVLQQLRLKLMGEGRLAQYEGRGPLQGWLRRAAINTSKSMQDQPGRDRHAEGTVARPVADPEFAILAAQFQAGFKVAFEEAMSRLSAREKMMLRLNGLADYSIDQIGEIYSVHRATAARWVQAARRRLHEETRAAVARTLLRPGDDVDEVMRQFGSQVDLSVRRLLQEGHPSADVPLRDEPGDR
jgi:RNA polymerase sigma-70 factor (ECF subfamily)